MASHLSDADTERTSGRTTPRVRPGTRGAVEDLNNHLIQLTSTLQASGAQYANIGQLGPSTAETLQGIEQLQDAVNGQTIKQRKSIDDTKDWVRHDLRNQIFSQLRNDLRGEIKVQVAKTVKDQVDAQIGNHIPIPLHKQLEESKEQLRKVKVMLVNSKARADHAHYDLETNLNVPLSAVQKESGEKSDIYPSDLLSLFAYDDQTVKQLVLDYGLKADENPVENMNRFLAHIGIKRRVEAVSRTGE
ncbi:hypothetical protein V5O48_000717 [Marasmius crinis-equi]|uniref:Uncharacterized protein n=1 Tax=Marasmius crinis-equi TaxID=585013 RepID=A0ABR3G0L7_9AGAR